jgi:hypothetical protein
MEMCGGCYIKEVKNEEGDKILNKALCFAVRFIIDGANSNATDNSHQFKLLFFLHFYIINLLSAHDVISHHAVAVTQWPGCVITSQVSLNICKFCFKFLWELSEYYVMK